MIKELGVLHNHNINGCTVLFYSGNIGQGLPKHQHDLPHLTYCSSGSVMVRTAQGEQIIDKNTPPVNLPENMWHELEILESPSSFVNIFENTYGKPSSGIVLINGNPVRVG